MQNQLKEDLNDFLKEKEELREVIGESCFKIIPVTKITKTIPMNNEVIILA